MGRVGRFVPGLRSQPLPRGPRSGEYQLEQAVQRRPIGRVQMPVNMDHPSFNPGDSVDEVPRDWFEYPTELIFGVTLVWPVMAAFLIWVSVSGDVSLSRPAWLVVLAVGVGGGYFSWLFLRAPNRFELMRGSLRISRRGASPLEVPMPDIRWKTRKSATAFLFGAEELEVSRTGEKLLVWKQLERFEEFRDLLST